MPPPAKHKPWSFLFSVPLGCGLASPRMAPHIHQAGIRFRAKEATEQKQMSAARGMVGATSYISKSAFALPARNSTERQVRLPAEEAKMGARVGKEEDH